jgi:exonuclease V gamma subunit
LDQLRHWLQAYAQAWQRPLPVALRSALAYLEAMKITHPPAQATSHSPQQALDGEESLTEFALGQAQDVFDCSFATEGEWSRSPYLQRSFESFEDIAPDLPKWAHKLYGGLMTQVQLTLTPESAQESDSQPGPGA